jgi:quercetin 2,3-dioxygenase
VTGPSPEPDVSGSRVADVGGMTVHRALPHKGRRTVGAWCFLDRFGPVDVLPSRTMTVGPHPHIGLHTVTWLLAGEVLHTDSLGSEQLIRPGQLNLMTAGNGIAHAEDARHQPAGLMDGVQFWVAQPDATRHGPSAFAHHAELPHVDVGIGEATVLLGAFTGVRSPAQVASPLVGLDITVRGPIELPLVPEFEYALMVLSGAIRSGHATAFADELMYVGTDREHIHLEVVTRPASSSSGANPSRRRSSCGGTSSPGIVGRSTRRGMNGRRDPTGSVRS